MVFSPSNYYKTAVVRYTDHWYTGTIHLQTGYTDQEDNMDTGFSFIAMS